MAMLTPLPFDDARVLLGAYGFELVGIQPLLAGSVNSNFFVEVEEKGVRRTFFARIYEEQGDEGARFELRLNQVLHAAKISVAQPVLTSNKELHCQFFGKPFALYERLEGEVLCQKRVTEKVARDVGAALAAVHLAPLGSLALQPSRFGSSGVEQRLLQVEESRRKDLLPALRRLRLLVGDLQQSTAEELPMGLIHGDLFRDNVLVRNERVVGLLDFESASFGNLVYDLMVTVLAWCFGDALDLKLVRAMIEGYDEHRPLSVQERRAMVREGSFACARFAATRLTDFSLRVPEGVAPARDYRRFFERLDALVGGELERALEATVWRADQ